MLDEADREIDSREASRAEVEAWLAREYAGVRVRFVPMRNPGSRPRKQRNVTDRALRYRANADPPPGPRICALCGSRRNVEVGHANSREEDNSPANLFWTCRRCNTKSGITLKRAGIGRRTRQYNPTAAGAENLGQWMNAVTSMKGEGGTMAVADAVAMIRATPPDERSRFAREIWAIRRRRGTDRSAVPF